LLRTVTHERLKTSTKRPIPTVICDWISDKAKEDIAKQKVADEDRILAAIDADPTASWATLAVNMEWKLFNGEPNKTKVSRHLKALEKAKLIKQTRSGKYRLSPEGKKTLKNSQAGDDDDRNDAD
jgi:hypothetical protein